MKTIAVVCLLLAVAASSLQAQESTSSQSPVRQQEIDRLKRQIEDDTRSSVEAVMDYHNESGDLNNRLNFFRYGGRLNLKVGSSSSFLFTGTRTDYHPLNSNFDRQGTNATAGFQTKLSESVDAHVEAGATRFSTDTTSFNAFGSVTYNYSDAIRIYGIASRENVEESLLSAVGIRPEAGPFAGQIVGQVMENRFVVGGSSPLIAGFDVFGEGGVGTREGRNVPSNFFKTIYGGAGYNIIAGADGDPISLLRGMYEFTYYGFDTDRFGFGGASFLTRSGVQIIPSRIGSDLISPNPGDNPGTGGYFSPKNFYGNIGRVEARGGSDDNVSYHVSGFVGTQNYTGSSNRWATGLSATVQVGITDRVYLPVTYVIDNFGPFTQQSLYARLGFRF